MHCIHLTVDYSTGYSETAELAEGEYTLGAGADAQIVLHAESVAPRHAVIWLSLERIEIEPLAPEVGVNGSAIGERVGLDLPVTIQVAEITLTFEIREAALEEVAPEESAPEDVPAGESVPEESVVHHAGSPGLRLDPDATVVPFPRGTKPRKPLEVTLTPQISSEAMSEPRTVRDGQSEAPLRGSYRLTREIARGGMGKIYAGDDPQLKREVAVKVSSFGTGGMDARFSMEAEVLAQLAHPNIVPIYAIGVDSETRPYYAMKLVKGRTLQAVLDAIRSGKTEVAREYPVSTLLTIFRKVCDAMAFAHSKRILHRDLKPDNVMVGEYGEVLVMDWGLAKLMGSADPDAPAKDAILQSSDAVGMTLEGDVMGTPQYMSPEQAEGRVAELDERSDIYSLGGVLYALLTLRPPVEGTSVQEVLTKVRSGQISSMISRGTREKIEVGNPSAMDRAVPEALQAVTRKAMNRNASHRYSSVEEFAADIEAYQNGFATQAEEAGALKQIALFIKRHKAFSAMAVCFLAGASVFTWQLVQSERRAVQNERISRQSAAAAQISLAEAAEETADSERMRDALLRVPPELRDANWEYLEKRSDCSDLEIHPPDKSVWKSVSDSLGEQDVFVGLQANGQLHRIHAVTGAVTPLWKAERPGFTLPGLLQVSPDSKQIALVWAKGNTPHREIEVRQMEGGTLLSSVLALPASEGRTLTNMALAKGTLVVRSNKIQSPEDSVLEAWDVESGNKLWEKPQIRFVQSGTSMQSVLAFSSEGKTLQLDVHTGEPQREDFGLFDSRALPSMDLCTITPDGISLLNTSANLIRKWDGKKGVMLWQTQGPFYAPLAIQAAAPPANLFAVLGRRSMLGCVLEIRTLDGGSLLKSAPFLNKNSISRIARTKDAFAVATAERILVWHARKTPVSRGISPSNQAYSPFAPAGGGHWMAAALFNGKDAHELSLWTHEEQRSKSHTVASLPIDGVTEKRNFNLQGNPSGSHLLAQIDDRAATFEIRGDKIEPLLKVQRLPVAAPANNSAIAVHPQGKEFLLGGKIFDFATGKERVSLKRPLFVFTRVLSQRSSGCWVGTDSIAQIALFRADDEEESEERRTIVLSDTKTGDIRAHVSAPAVAVLSASPDGKWVAEGGADKRVRVRNARSLEVEHELRAHDSTVLAFAWHPKLPLLVSAERGRIRIWNTELWRMVEQMDVSAEDPWVDVSEDGKWLILSRKTVDYFAPKSFAE
jgi:serine/threonine protein kinase/WD40 repeat protein